MTGTRMDQAADPLIAFVHIPKNAGSTVNRLLMDWDDRGNAHCESVTRKGSAYLSSHLDKLKWISGHLSLPKFKEELRPHTARRIDFFTLLREPVAQVASHYNWLIEIFHRGKSFYNGHPENIRAISSRIRAADNSDPHAVIGLLSDYRGLFLNPQSRYALGPNASGLTTPELMRRIDEYAFIGAERDMAKLIEKATGHSPEFSYSENSSRYHFDRDVFTSPELARFLKENNADDMKLYDCVMNRS